MLLMLATIAATIRWWPRRTGVRLRAAAAGCDLADLTLHLSGGHDLMAHFLEPMVAAAALLDAQRLVTPETVLTCQDPSHRQEWMHRLGELATRHRLTQMVAISTVTVIRTAWPDQAGAASPPR